MKNIETIREIYAAFGKGDVNAILERMHDDVEWEYGSVDSGVPWLARRRGRAGVARFFQTVAETLEFKVFAVDEIVGNDRVVIALARVEALVKSTGKTLREDAEAHLWHFDAAGKIVKFRHAADTLGHTRAYSPSATPIAASIASTS